MRRAAELGKIFAARGRWLHLHTLSPKPRGEGARKAAKWSPAWNSRAPGGEIFYTTKGTDLRALNGMVAGARAVCQPMVIDRAMKVVARAQRDQLERAC